MCMVCLSYMHFSIESVPDHLFSGRHEGPYINANILTLIWSYIDVLISVEALICNYILMTHYFCFFSLSNFTQLDTVQAIRLLFITRTSNICLCPYTCRNVKALMNNNLVWLLCCSLIYMTEIEKPTIREIPVVIARNDEYFLICFRAITVERLCVEMLVLNKYGKGTFE